MGRLKLAGERYPSGKLKPQTTPPAMVRRIIDAARVRASDPLLSTEIGRLRLTGVVTDSDLAAAIVYAEAVGAYDRMKGLPSRTAASPSYERGYGAGAGELDFEDEMILADLLDSDAKLPAETKLSDWVRQQLNLSKAAQNSDKLKRILKAVRRFEYLNEAVRKTRGGHIAMQNAVILNEHIPVGWHQDLRNALKAVKDAIARWQIG